jgi:nucleoside-diphosphate-sugar epimerase
MIKILMTGGSGFLGGHLIRRAAAEKLLKTKLLDCPSGIQKDFPRA